MTNSPYGESTFTGTGCGIQMQERTASANHFAQTTASPTSLATIMRSSLLVRPLDQPLVFPLDIHNFSEFEN